MRQTAKDLGVSLKMVFGAVSKYTNASSFDNIPKKERCRMTSAREDRKMALLSKRDPFLSSIEIQRLMQGQHDCVTSARTVRRRLQQFNLRGCIAKRKPLV